MHRRSTLIFLLFLVVIAAGLLSVFRLRPATAVRADTSRTALAQVPSTLRDFLLPGTQPNNLIHALADQGQCQQCHSSYVASIPTSQSPDTETWHAWQGSMMAQAGRDPLFFAALDVANAGAANAGEFCLRCHMPRGWLSGRSSAPDASEMTTQDREGVECSVCHRMVDPANSPGSPQRDAGILAALEQPVTTQGSGQYIIDPEDYRRGPFDVIADLGSDPHVAFAEETLVSPFHQSARFCGTCHDINNPMFTWDELSQSYKPNTLDEPGEIGEGFPIERTFSEWQASAYNSTQGVYAPQFGGNRDFVAACQDCHMRATTGAAAVNKFNGAYIIRNNMPLHDLTGSNTWVPQIITMHPDYSSLFAAGSPRRAALDNGVERARYMLQHAARLDIYRQGTVLTVTVYNESGHKLPTGYVEGRRMWLQVLGYSATGQLMYSSGAYDKQTGELQGYQGDPTLKLYEARQGLTPDWADQLGLPAGKSFHFALNNEIVSDNRIPPRGYTFDAFAAVQAAPYTDGKPDPQRYADGQYWDTTVYSLPQEVAYGEVQLLFQVASKEYIEFLRANNPDAADPNSNGEILFNLWQESGRSEPEVMVAAHFTGEGGRQYLPALQRP